MKRKMDAERERRRAAAARRAREVGPPSLPEWPLDRLRPRFSSEAEEVQFLRSYDFSKYWESKRASDESAPEGTERDLVYRLRLAKREMEALQVRARELGVPVSIVLRDLIQAMPRDRGIHIDPGATALLPVEPSTNTPAGAFAHLSVANTGPAVFRVRCWMRFFTRDNKELFTREMPARWASAPEPFNSSASCDAVPAIDFWKMSLGYLADFAPREEHAVAVAIKFSDGTCWGWTPESYVHQWRHPDWRLPSELLRVRAHVMADGRDFYADFVLDASASSAEFKIRLDRMVVPMPRISAESEVGEFERRLTVIAGEKGRIR